MSMAKKQISIESMLDELLCNVLCVKILYFHDFFSHEGRRPKKFSTIDSYGDFSLFPWTFTTKEVNTPIGDGQP